MKYMDIPQLNQLSRLLSYESSECNVHTRIECYSMKPITKDKRLWKTLEKEYVEDQMEVNHALFGKDANLSPPSTVASIAQAHSNGEKGRRSRSIDIASSTFSGGRRSASFHSYPSHPQNHPASISPSDSAMRAQFCASDNENDDFLSVRNEPTSAFRLPGQLDRSERKTLFVLKSTLNSAFPHHDFAALGADQFSREKNAAAVLGSLSNTFRSVGVPSSFEGRGDGVGRGTGAGTGGRGGYTPAGGVTTYSTYPGEGSLFTPQSLPTRSEGVDPLKELERRQDGKGEYDPEVVSATHPVLFTVLDEAIGLKRGEYEVYVWTPGDLECDPHHGGGAGPDDSEEDSSTEDEDDEGPGSNEFEPDETESEEDDAEYGRPFYYPGGISIRRPPSPPPSSYSSGGFAAIRQAGSFPTPKELKQRVEGEEAYGLIDASSSYTASSSRPSHRPPYGRDTCSHSVSPTRGGSRLRLLRGSLLWSNHWFFVNRKQKRVLFISIWAKSRAHGFSPSSNRGMMKHGPSSLDARGGGGGSTCGGTGGETTTTTTTTTGSGIGGERFIGWQGGHGAGARAFAARAGSSLF